MVIKKFSILGEAILSACLVIAVFLAVTSRTAAFAGLRTFVVQSGSMAPNIPLGSIIITANTWFYDVGDVIAFKDTRGLTITHRIAEKLYKPDGIYLRVKGDANNAPDSELVPIDKVIGKGAFIFPYLGLAATFLKRPVGFILLIVLPASVFITIELMGIKKEIEKDAEKKLLARIYPEAKSLLEVL